MDAKPTCPARRVRFAAPVVNILACLAGFVAACWCIGRLAPAPAVPDVQPKLDYFSRHKTDYDTLFIGSSRFLRQVSPAVFDGTLRAAGLESRTFNFGIDGMFPPESCHLLDRIADLKPPGLKRVFFELAAMEVEVDEMQKNGVRA